MGKRIMALLMAMAVLSLAWLGPSAWGQARQVQDGFRHAQGAHHEVAQLLDLLTEKRVITPQERAMLHRGKPSPVSKDKIKEQNPASDCLRSCP